MAKSTTLMAYVTALAESPFQRALFLTVTYSKKASRPIYPVIDFSSVKSNEVGLCSSFICGQPQKEKG